MRVLYLGVLLCVVALLCWAGLEIVHSNNAREPVHLGRVSLDGGALTVVVFGTSLSAPSQTWPELLQDQLAECRGDVVAMQRVTGPGHGSDWALQQLDRVVATAPDLVLIEFSINDADIRDGVSLRQSINNHELIIDALRQKLPRAQLLLLTMSPAYGVRGWARPRLAKYYDSYEELASKKKVAFINLNEYWKKRAGADQGLGGDGLHPDPDTAAEIIVPPLIRFLCPI